MNVDGETAATDRTEDTSPMSTVMTMKIERGKDNESEERDPNRDKLAESACFKFTQVHQARLQP